jgi:hypothetical protein
MLKGIFPTLWRVRGEFPDAELPGSTNLGSFDCVVVRFADDNFAQDDNWDKQA